MGYSPFLISESPLHGDSPADDGRYALHLPMMRQMGVNYLHLFPRHMPAGFFAALDRENFVYSQNIKFVRLRNAGAPVSHGCLHDGQRKDAK